MIRAIDFLTAQPEWDGRTVIVYGSSQGGFQALAAAVWIRESPLFVLVFQQVVTTPATRLIESVVGRRSCPSTPREYRIRGDGSVPVFRLRKLRAKAQCKVQR